MMNYIKLNNNHKDDSFECKFIYEKILVEPIDYYYSNVIARSSYTMSECRKEKLKMKSTGTDG